MPIAHVNGADVHFTDTGLPPGRPDAATVVFGHGLLFSGWMFTDQVEALKDEYRCVTIDWRSQGQSPAARDGHDMDTLTLDLVALLDQLELDPVHYVGLSMGGYVGMRFAARYPDRVLSLTLLDTDAGPEDPRTRGSGPSTACSPTSIDSSASLRCGHRSSRSCSGPPSATTRSAEP